MNKKRAVVCDCDVVHVEVVNKVKGLMPPEDDLFNLSDFFKVLGDSTRMKIIWALDQAELCVCDLAVALNMTKSAISHQLSTLKQAKIVKYRRDGKKVFYSLDDQHVTDIIEISMIHLKHQ